MADITIDSSSHVNQNNKMTPRSLVWTSPTVGYIFFLDHLTDFKYRKTTNSGGSWTDENTIRTGTVQKFQVWYDKWTKGDTGGFIHIAFIDSGDDDITYNSLDTSDDSLGGEVTVFAGASASGNTDWAGSCISIVKARGGNIYVGGWIDISGEEGFFRSTASPATSFTSRTSMADGNAVDGIIFTAGNETATNDIFCCYYDRSAAQITLKVYNDAGNTWTESTGNIDAMDDVGWFQMDAMDRHSDNHTLLTMWNEHDSATGDLAFHDITNSGAFTQKTDVISNGNGLAIMGLMINQQNDDLYVAYDTGVFPNSKIVYKKSQSGADSWGSEQVFSQQGDDQRTICGGSSVQNDGGRFCPIWFNDDTNDLLTNSGNSVVFAAVVASGLNMKINIGDVWKDVSAVKLNIGDVWKDVDTAKINIADTWKNI